MTLHERTPQGLTRRGLLSLALAGAGAAALAGCAPRPTARGTATVRVWDPFQGADGARMQAMQASVMEAERDIRIESVTLAWGAAYYTKLAMASAGGRAPEAAVMHLSRLAGYAPGGLLEPFDLDRLADLGIRQQDFAPAVWERATFEGRLYALPLDTHPFLTFYDPAIADPAGILDADGGLGGITSPDAFLDAGRRLAEVTGDTGIAFGYLLDTAQAWRFFWGLYNQTGGGSSFVPGRRAELDEAKAAEVIEFLQQMMDGTVAAQRLDYSGGIASFVTGRSGMIVSGEWELPAFQEAIPDVAGRPLPTLFGTPANYADSHAFVLPRQIRRDPAVTDATYRTLAAILKGAQVWAEAGHIPAYTPVTQTAEYQALTPQRDYAAASEIIVLDPPAWFVGAGSDFQARMSDPLSSALQGRQDARTTVQSMLRAADVFLTQPEPA
ncbi:extracellular solute-binding protein [Microbacterium rhizophilus]|uniref:extracellular solute-binding protein n=1 Tax=Microbacterium rhizophilus TaxID=3138934 RepID=UPI0031E845D8